MATEILTVVVKALDQFSGTFARAKAQTTGMSGALGGMSKSGMIAATAAVVVAKGLWNCAKAAMENEAAVAQVDSALKSTGSAANVTSKHVQALATTIQNYSGYSDEAVLSASSMMLTFKKVKNEGSDPMNQVFDRSIELTADLAKRFNMELPQAAKMLGKALEDPTTGLTAMRRAGVSFTTAQKDMIISLYKSGDAIGAQKIILAELETQVGGAAKAFGDTFAGKIEIAKQKFDDLKETFGKVVMSGLLPYLESISSVLGVLSTLKFDTALSFLNKGASYATSWLNPITAIHDSWTGLNSLFGTTTITVEALWQDMGKLGSAIADNVREFMELQQVSKQAFTDMDEAVKRVLQTLGEKGLSGVMQEDLAQMMEGFISTSPKLQDQALEMFQGIIDIEMRTMTPAAQEIMGTAMDNIKQRIEALPAAERTRAKMMEIITQEIAAAGPISAEMQNIMNNLAGIVGFVDLGSPMARAMSGISAAILAAQSGISSALDSVLGAIVFKMGQISAMLVQLPTLGRHQGGAVYHQGGAVRAHGGAMMSDERQIIAQTGEGVVSRKGMKAMGGVRTLNAINRGDVGGGTVVNFNSTFSMASDSEMRRAAKKLNKYLALEGAR